MPDGSFDELKKSLVVPLSDAINHTLNIEIRSLNITANK